MTSDTREVPPETVLERLVESVEASVPGLSLRGVVGRLRPAQELFPDQIGHAELAVDPRLRLRELGVVVSYNGDDGWGYRGSVSSDPSIHRWADFATQLLANVQEISCSPAPGPGRKSREATDVSSPRQAPSSRTACFICGSASELLPF